MPDENTMERRRREGLRRSYRPARLRLLFIGEAPPASGRFFYRGDSGLYRAVRDTFQIVDPSIHDESFLTVFRALGCYLVDLCPEPVDHLDRKSRQAACRSAEQSLSMTIARLQPAMIATVLHSIKGNVAQAALQAAWQGPCLHLPYPGRWSRYRDVFVDTLAPTIRGLMQLKPPAN